MRDTEKILNVVTGNQKGEPRKKLVSSLDNDSETKEEFNKVKNAWALLSATKPMPEYQVENLYLKFKKQLDRKQKSFSLSAFNLLKYAAVFILAAGLSSLFLYVQSGRFLSPAAKICTSVIADNGQISKVILPDSSVVWLNSGTQITYNNNFAVDNREINLTGQAFFQVTKNRKLPLRVFSGNMEVKVIGTRFDVNAYPEDKTISVVLESGKVEVLDTQDKTFHYELVPGEMVQYNTASKNVSSTKVNLEEFTSWKEGVLTFRDEPMPAVITWLQRRYDIDIEVKDSEVYKSVFTATIKNETLDEIFKSIGFSCSIHYKIIRGNNLNTKTRIILCKKS